MPQQLGGTFTLRDAIKMTHRFARTRFDNMNRDVIRRITIQQIRSYDPDRLDAPTLKYTIRTRSYPQYREYLTKTGGSKKRRSARKFQRTVKHDYETILQFGDEGISLHTRKWKIRVGSGRKWLGKKPPQNQIHQIYNETVERWRKRLPNEEAVREKKRQHRKKRYKYLSVGDYLAQALGIMMDFSIRLAYVYRKHNHLYGYCFGSERPPEQMNPREHFFLTKHTIRIIDTLGRKGVFDAK